jgi:AraC-like DNA-binding protein
VADILKPSIHFSLRAFAPADRFDRWNETLEATGHVTDFNNVDADFHAEFVLRSIGALTVGDFRTTRADVYRTRKNIAKAEVRGFLIFQQVGSEGSHFRIGNQEQTKLGSGDVVITNADRPFASRSADLFHHRVTVIPRSRLQVSQTELGRLEDGLILRSGNTSARLINALLGEVYNGAETLPASASDGLMDAVAGLIAAAAGAESEDAIAIGELALVHRRMRRHMRDPLLSPSMIAAECGISLRKLHGLFEGTGHTFGSFLRASRLDIARSALGNPRNTLIISDLAGELGFNSLATFYRAYRDAFGEAPGDTRASAVNRQLT